MKQFMPESTQQERLRLLQENALSTENATYQKPLTTDELNERRESLADNCIKLNQKEDELAEIKAEFKPEMDSLKKTNKTLLLEIKTKQETITGNLYNLPDYENSMMETYDSEGYLIGSRRLRPEEKQGNIFKIAK